MTRLAHPELEGLSPQEHLNARIEIGRHVVKHKAFVMGWLAQIAGFLCLLAWLPRGAFFLPLLLAYISAGVLLLEILRKRIEREFVRRRFGPRTV